MRLAMVVAIVFTGTVQAARLIMAEQLSNQLLLVVLGGGLRLTHRILM